MFMGDFWVGETAFIMEVWPPIRAIIRISLDFINTLGSFEFMKKRRKKS